MKRQNAIRGNLQGSLVFDVRGHEWSARATGVFDTVGPALLISLPHGLFLAHDREMGRVGARVGPALESDAEYLSEVWGFTRILGDEAAEIVDTPVIGVRPTREGLVLELAGYPWLLVDAQTADPEDWMRMEAESFCLLGVCFGIDLDAPDSDLAFLSELSTGTAALGQVQVMPQP
ncbi:hypothetical protein ACGFMM_10870 [Streptomyces sp. NPDC048604]|uniref:hypothetical protein n=1 Tax=Streptomyces sp. NPDC048604 TaxID=3365578 RepID=UPI00371387F2